MIPIIGDNQTKINQDLMNAMLMQGEQINKLFDHINTMALHIRRLEKQLQEKLKEKVEV